MGLNDGAWERLFAKYRILDQISQRGHYVISASQIKQFREPRLMTKFDHRVNLPRIFADNGLAILPISRGDYMIASFSAYEAFEAPAAAAQRVSVPPQLQSLMPQFLVSEAIALNCAGACGILQDFLGEERLVPTVSGRMSSGRFGFRIQTGAGLKEVAVNHAQIEIDGAYEGANSLSLFEAKRDLAEDFLVRQLYYPFRVWSGRVTKPVNPVFLIFSNGTFYLYQYRFEDPANYSSLHLVKQKNYVLAADITRADLEGLLEREPPAPEPPIAFPQANSMSRIVNLMELLSEQPMTRQEITDQYGFDGRQTNYYTDAGRYLGLIDKDRAGPDGAICFLLSKLGGYIMGLGYRERQLALAAQILRHRAFRETLKLRLRCGAMPDTQAIVAIMRASGLYHVEAGSTFVRRSSTVAGWVNWIWNLIGT